MKKLCLMVLALISAMVYGQQKKDSLALFPFTGGNETDGKAIVSSLARQRTLRNAFNKVTLITDDTIKTMNFEHQFQRDSGLTDADTIFELGKKLNASYVVSGYITRLRDQNLVLVSIMDVESLQQVAGDYRVYKTIEEIDALIPEMAKKLADGAVRDTGKLPGLSVPPFVVSKEVNANDAQVLAQILSCELANGNKYAVLPRTDSLEAVRVEHQRQRSGGTDSDRAKRLGAGRNAQYVLSGGVQQLGRLSKLTADILDINDGSFIDGYEEQYADLSEGLGLAPKLAVQLMGVSTATTTAQEPAGKAETPNKTYKIGDTGPGGGIIFYVEGNNGLEVSRYLGEHKWEDAKKVASNYRGGDKSDWYLPNKGELDLMYRNLQKSDIANLIVGSDSYYWSSSVFISGYAWYQKFTDGKQNGNATDNTNSVRVIRAF